MQEILDRPYRRRNFFALVILVLVLLFVGRYYVIPAFNNELALQPLEFWASFVEKLSTSLVSTIAIASFVFWLTPKIVKKATLHVVDPNEISGLLQNAVLHSDFWTFRGGIARHTRAETLPQLAAISRDRNSARQLHIQILDPVLEPICEAYAQYRRGLHSTKPSDLTWTAERVANEVCATIVCAFITSSAYPLLEVSITLLPVFSSFRIDLSSEYAILTKEDRRDPAMKCERASYFYDAYRNDLALTHKQGRAIDISSALSVLSVDTVREMLYGIGMKNLSDERIGLIIGLAKEPKSPYA